MTDEFQTVEVKPRKVLSGFNVVKHKQHGATSIYILRKDLKNKPWEKYCIILDFIKTKYDVRKANVKL